MEIPSQVDIGDKENKFLFWCNPTQRFLKKEKLENELISWVILLVYGLNLKVL
jgi:hypothetical protein